MMWTALGILGLAIVVCAAALLVFGALMTPKD
jgi:hypothetical protein